MRSWKGVSALLIALAACSLYAQPIRVLTTGDMHGWIEAQKADDRTLGGTAEMLSYWKRVEGYKPEKFLVLSAGDIATGPVISTVFKGESVIDVMNKMGYDACVLGNHEFDFGVDQIRTWQQTAKFAFVSANIVGKSGAPAGFVKPYAIIDQEGVKVAVIGLTTTDLHTLTPNAGGYSLEPYAETLKKVVPEVKKDGAQVVIVLAHVEQDQLVRLAESLQELGISLMIGGHTHEFAQRLVGNTWVVNSGEWWKSYTRVDLDYSPKSGKTVALSSKQVRVLQENPSADGSVKREIDKWNTKLGAEYGTPVGYTVTGLNRDVLYQLVTEAFLTYDQTTDVAMTNYGGLRQDVPAGPVTRGMIVGVMPFQNSFIRVKLTGEQVINGISGNAFAGIKKVGDGWVLTKSGQPLDPKAVYNVTMNNYMYGVSGLFTSADPKPETLSGDWRTPVYEWLKRKATDKSNPIEKAIGQY